MGKLMIIMPDPETNPTLCILIEKKYFNQDDQGNVSVEGPENTRTYSIDGALAFCAEINKQIQNK